MTAALVLLDVENWFRWDGTLWKNGGEPDSDPVWPPAGSDKRFPLHSLRVVLAMNLIYARQHCNGVSVWNRERLEQIVSDIGTCLGVPHAVCSYELVLSSGGPEASDRVLHLSLRAAPDEEPGSVGPFSHVFLFSEDKGLRLQFATSPLCRKPETVSVNRIFVFKGLQHRRRMPEKAIVPGDMAALPRTIQGPTVFVTDRETAGHMADMRVQSEGALHAIAKTASRFPALLSQVSVTATTDKPFIASARGVHRLQLLLAGEKPLLACHPSDNLEWDTRLDDGFRLPPGCPYPVEVNPSPLGPGIVRLSFRGGDDVCTLTARSRLPLQILQKAAPCIAPPDNWATGSEIDDERVLSSTLNQIFAESKLIRFRGVRGGFACEIQQSPLCPSDWWFSISDRGISKASSKQKCRFDCQSTPSLDVTALPSVLRDTRGKPCVAWRTVMHAGEGFESRRPVAKGTIGVAVSTVDHRTVPILALTDLPGGPIAQVHPVQDLPFAFVRAVAPSLATRLVTVWNELIFFPLLIALNRKVYIPQRVVRNTRNAPSTESERVPS